jgi:hypothetical protein
LCPYNYEVVYISDLNIVVEAAKGRISILTYLMHWNWKVQLQVFKRKDKGCIFKLKGIDFIAIERVIFALTIDAHLSL